MNRRWLPFVMVVFLVVVMGWLTRNFDLIYDSRALLTRHPVITGAEPWQEAFSRPYLGRLGDDRGLNIYFRPLPVLSFFLGRALWGVNPGMERNLNLVLFLLWLTLVYGLVCSREKNRFLAAMVMLFCAAFPLNWDNVIWVAGRPDLLMLVFGTAALWMLERDSRNDTWNQFFAVIFFGLALLSKESAFFLLPLLVLPMGRCREPNWVVRAGFVFSALVVCVLRHGATGYWGAPGMQGLTLGSAIIRVVGAAGVYVRCMLFPFGVTPYLPPEWVPSGGELLFGALMLGGLTWLAYRWWTQPHERLGAALFLTFTLGHLLAVLSDLSLAVAPRFMTVPFLAVVWWVLKAAGRFPRIQRIVTVVLLLAYVPFMPLQAAAYRDNTQYWRHLNQAYPDSAHFSMHLAREHITTGRFLEAETLLVQMKPETARDFYDVQLLRANVDLARADYPALQRRLDVVASGTMDAAAVASASRLRARMLLLQGNEDAAFAVMDALIQRHFRAEWVREFHRMLLGRLRWQRARELESLYSPRGVVFSVNADETAAHFARMSVAERLNFFIRNWNPGGALALLAEMPRSERIVLMQAGMHYFVGEPQRATQLLDDWAHVEGREKAVGEWYLGRMQRPREALSWLQRDVKRHGAQIETLRMIRQLKTWPRHRLSARGEE